MSREVTGLRRSHGRGVYEAFSAMVQRDGARGVEALAAFMGTRPGTLYNKANADDATHHQPTLRDLILVTHFLNDFSALDALNEQFGRVCFDCTPLENVSDAALLELACKLGKENGEFHGAMAAALAGNFTRESLLRVRGEAFDVVAALMTLVARLEGLVDDRHE